MTNIPAISTHALSLVHYVSLVGRVCSGVVLLSFCILGKGPLSSFAHCVGHSRRLGLQRRRVSTGDGRRRVPTPFGTD